jgi:CRP-like cAMP-binding protein
METNPVSSFDVMGFLTQQRPKRTPSKYQTDQVLYSQGDPADSVFYIHKGKVKLTVISERGKQAIVAIRGPDEFCGEGALTGSRFACLRLSRSQHAKLYGWAKKP